MSVRGAHNSPPPPHPHPQVSLYQILPRPTNSSSAGGRPGRATVADHPMRLLDIRRIDLDSSGWETFYVKRAVEDWLRDASLNLGERRF